MCKGMLSPKLAVYSSGFHPNVSLNFIFRVMDAAALRHIYNASTDAQYYVNIHDL